MDKKQIDSLRNQIDGLDRQLLDLLNARAQLAQEIGHVKKESCSPVFHPQREAQVIADLMAINAGPLRAQSIGPIWREIMSACRSLEQVIRVAFLGPAGSFTEQAVLNYFGSGVELEPCTSLDAIFQVVDSENCRFGVVPIENSTEGVVTRSLDLLQQTPLKIVGEVGLRIRHNLLALQEKPEHIEVVYAHPQALAQCQGWLSAHVPLAKREAVSSNAEGARLAALDSKAGAIASARAASLMGLQIVAQGIQDVSSNRTRFAVLAQHHEVQPPFTDQTPTCTSVVVSVANRPGAVHDLLAPLKKYGVTLTRFESRPARSDQWEYFFYMDIDGHVGRPEVAQALEEVRQMCSFYKLLGSYAVHRE